MVTKRILRHGFLGKWHLRRVLPPEECSRIALAVREAERGHSGQIRVVVEGSLGLSDLIQRHTARERAIEVFASERVWDTENNNGVLLYLLVADRDAEIVSDRGTVNRIAREEWEAICKDIEASVASHGLGGALSRAVTTIGELLRREFPAANSLNELPDEVLVR